MLKTFIRNKLLLCTCLLPILLSGCAMLPGKATKSEEAKAVKVPAEVAAEFGSAIDLMKAKDYKAALKSLEALVKKHPNYAGLWSNIAIARMQVGQKGEALKAIEQALVLNDKSYQAFTIKGLILQAMGQFKAAKTAFEQALALNDDYKDAHYNAGVLADMYLQEFEQALEHYERYQALLDKPDKRIEAWIVDLKRRIK